MRGSQGPSPGSWDQLHGPSPHLAIHKQVPPYPHPDGTPESHRRAQEEKLAFDERRLVYQAKQGEHDRTETLRNNFNYAAVAGIWCAALVLFAGFILWAIHLLTPDSWHFLTPQQISKIESMVTTGSVATLVANYIRRRL